MTWLTLAQIIADIPPEEETSSETPWAAVIIVMLVAFAVVGVVMARLRKKASQIEEI